MILLLYIISKTRQHICCTRHVSCQRSCDIYDFFHR